MCHNEDKARESTEGGRRTIDRRPPYNSTWRGSDTKSRDWPAWTRTPIQAREIRGSSAVGRPRSAVVYHNEDKARESTETLNSEVANLAFIEQSQRRQSS
jgi:hypothetical protein